jgi:hypothetical protein
VQPAGHRGGVTEGPVRVGEAAPVAQAVAGVALLLAAAGARDGHGCPAWHGAAVADSAGARFPEVPELAAVGAAAFQRGAGDPAMTDMAADPVTELDRCRAVGAGPVPGHSGGMERPRAAFGSGLARAGRTAGATGVVSTSNRRSSSTVNPLSLLWIYR